MCGRSMGGKWKCSDHFARVRILSIIAATTGVQYKMNIMNKLKTLCHRRTMVPGVLVYWSKCKTMVCVGAHACKATHNKSANKWHATKLMT